MWDGQFFNTNPYYPNIRCTYIYMFTTLQLYPIIITDIFIYTYIYVYVYFDISNHHKESGYRMDDHTTYAIFLTMAGVVLAQYIYNPCRDGHPKLPVVLM